MAAACSRTFLISHEQRQNLFLLCRGEKTAFEKRTFLISHEQRQDLFWLCRGEKYRANESNENLFSNCRVQPILCKTKDENPTFYPKQSYCRTTKSSHLISLQRTINRERGLIEWAVNLPDAEVQPGGHLTVTLLVNPHSHENLALTLTEPT